MLTSDLARRAEQLLRTYQHFRLNSLELLRFLVLPAHGEYECWRVIRRWVPRVNVHEYVGVWGCWKAFQDAAELFDPATGQAVRDDVEPTLVWRSVTLAPDTVEAFVESVRSTRIPLMCPMPTTTTDGVRYEAQFIDPGGSVASTSVLSWVSVAPAEWRAVESHVRNLVTELRRLMEASGATT